jgi:hypothetical protein
MDYSTKKVSTALVQELVDAIQNIRGWGSVEIQVQDFKVVQITERNVKKTANDEAKKLAKIAEQKKQIKS